MFNIKKILAPVDFSDPSGHAAQYALGVARHFDAELTLLHVLPTVRFEFALAEPATDRYRDLLTTRREHAEHALAEMVQRSLDDERVSAEVAEGDAAEVIIRRAHDGGFGAIVMSTRGAGPLRRWLLVGSVTSKVLYGADCPVISCSCFNSVMPPGHIVCAIDLGPQSERALRFANDIAGRFDARLSIVHAAPAMGEAAEDFFDESWRSTLVSRLREKVVALQAKLRVQGDVVVEAGNPPTTVAAAARRLDAGLLVLGRGASTDLIGRLSASGYDIIRESPCPVVTV